MRRDMAYVLDKSGTTRCTLDSNTYDTFSRKNFCDLITEAHARGHDYYIARVHCGRGDIQKNKKAKYSCYDARQLCKYVFEMVISADGRRIRIKNFKDPAMEQEILEVNFFRLRCDSDTPLRAEFVGNHVTFLESSSLRNKIFAQEDPSEALSVNFQFKAPQKLPYIERRNLLDVLMILFIVIILCLITFAGIRYGKYQLTRRDLLPPASGKI